MCCGGLISKITGHGLDNDTHLIPDRDVTLPFSTSVYTGLEACLASFSMDTEGSILGGKAVEA
jgi:hypothetical protein